MNSARKMPYISTWILEVVRHVLTVRLFWCKFCVFLNTFPFFFFTHFFLFFCCCFSHHFSFGSSSRVTFGERTTFSLFTFSFSFEKFFKGKLTWFYVCEYECCILFLFSLYGVCSGVRLLLLLCAVFIFYFCFFFKLWNDENKRPTKNKKSNKSTCE